MVITLEVLKEELAKLEGESAVLNETSLALKGAIVMVKQLILFADSPEEGGSNGGNLPEA